MRCSALLFIAASAGAVGLGRQCLPAILPVALGIQAGSNTPAACTLLHDCRQFLLARSATLLVWSVMLLLQASTHSRRLLSVKANGKFDDIDAGPEAPLEVRGRMLPWFVCVRSGGWS